VFEPPAFVARWVALIPPPRANVIRDHGVLAPRSRPRAQVVRDMRCSGSMLAVLWSASARL
jgi:hypothetical protein